MVWGLGAFVLSVQGQDTREGSQGDACPSGARDLTIYLEPDSCSLVKSELCGRVRGRVSKLTLSGTDQVGGGAC